MKLLFALALMSPLLVHCAAIYPEIGTRTRSIPAGQPLDPAPPSDVRWLRFMSATIPERTRDGRPWQADGKGANPYARLFVNEREVLKTPVQADTLSPTWPDGPKGNFKILPSDRLRIELWDANPLNDRPIASRTIGQATDENIVEKQIHIDFNEGASVVLAFEPAHAISGLGLWFELRGSGCAITRFLEGSPAQRAGLEPGDEVIKIGVREVKAMSADEIKSLFAAVPTAGLVLMVKHRAGPVVEVTVREGPIYPVHDQYGDLE